MIHYHTVCKHRINCTISGSCSRYLNGDGIDQQTKISIFLYIYNMERCNVDSQSKRLCGQICVQYKIVPKNPKRNNNNNNRNKNKRQWKIDTTQNSLVVNVLFIAWFLHFRLCLCLCVINMLTDASVNSLRQCHVTNLSFMTND